MQHSSQFRARGRYFFLHMTHVRPIPDRVCVVQFKGTLSVDNHSLQRKTIMYYLSQRAIRVHIANSACPWEWNL